MTTKTLSLSYLSLFIICALLVTSTMFNIQCSQQQVFDTTITAQSSILSDDKASQRHERIYSKSSFYDAMNIAQGLIDDGIRSEQQVTTMDDNETSSHKQFNLTTWYKRTNGGLTNEDRIKLSYIYSKAESVFEYGLGESTYMADAVGVQRYAGIDSDAKWVAMVRDQVPPSYRFYFADIGPTVAWGYPLDRQHVPAKAIYQYQIMPLVAENQPFDVYMVDGRYRVPCMIASFLHASARGANPNHTIVLLHDCYRAEYYMDGKVPLPKNVNLRTMYTKADHLIEVMDHSGNRLCVYKRKPQTTDDELLQFWQENYNMID